jgi:phage-related protein
MTGVSLNPMITNTTTGENMKLNTTLLMGETIIIDTELGTIEKDGVDISSTLDASSTYIQLAPGDNALELTDDTPEDLEVQVVAQWRSANI